MTSERHITELEKCLSIAIEALEDVRRHQEICGGSIAKLGATWLISNTALKAIERLTPATSNETPAQVGPTS